ncbi:MAG: hypothetical protein AAB401_06040 [Acidobacteriota bacterium]
MKETVRGDVTKRSVTFKDLSGIYGGNTTASLSNHLTNKKTDRNDFAGRDLSDSIGEIRSVSVM